MNIQESGQCVTNDDCSWLYECDSNYCSHISIFPSALYPYIIYALIPLASGLVNLTGNSMGIFKVLILMNLLRYDVGQSTSLIQPMVAGTALSNFISLLPKKHPSKPTSLVSFNLVYILIPACLFGSTLGALAHLFIPEIVQDALIVLAFTYFVYGFIIKVLQLRKNRREKQGQLKLSLQTDLNTESLIVNQTSYQKQKIAEQSQEYNKILEYQQSWHLKDVGLSFVVFLVFELLAFLVQGKFPFASFDLCTWLYPLGLVLLACITFGYLWIMRKPIKQKFQIYRQFKFPYDIPLQEDKKYWKIAAGGLAAGFMQGTLGVGSGTCIMAVLLAQKLDPRVASATSGYQIFFVGAASLTQQLINENISLIQAGFFMGLCFFIGGLVTLLFYGISKRFDQDKLKQSLVIIICFLCLVSIIGVFPSVIETYINFGWNQLTMIKFHC